MALPRNKKERELLELRARVAQLESELSTVAGDADSLHHDDIAPNPDPDPMDIIQLMEEELAMEQEIIPQEYSEAVDASVTSVEYGGVMDVQPTTSKRRIGRYPCSTCGRKFPFLSELKKHCNIHKSTEEREAIKKLECHICDKRFTWKCDLRRHLVTHGEERPHTCTLCKAAFKLPEGLKKHMVIHCENSVKCTKCRRTYKDDDALQAHSCDRDGSYPCETCQKSFVRKDILAVHRRMHTGERPYVCDICSKGFVTATKRKLHLATHQNKPYMCKCCSKSFPTSLALQKHLQISCTTWNEMVCLTDVNVVRCKGNRALVQVEPIIDNEFMNISEPNSEIEKSTSTNTVMSSNSTAQPSTFIPTAIPSALIPPSTLVGPAFTPVGPADGSGPTFTPVGPAVGSGPTFTPVDPAVGSGPTFTPVDPAVGSVPPTFMVPGSSVFVQLLSPLDKDNNPLHPQPSTSTEHITQAVTTPNKTNKHHLPHCLPTISISTFPDRLPPPCPFCGDTCEDADSLAEHMLVHMSPIPHRCAECKVGYETSDDMDTHDCQKPTFDCTTCSTSFPDYCALIAHIVSDHVELALPTRKTHHAKATPVHKICRYCETPFPSEHELTLHTTTEHSGSHPFKCIYCDKIFSKKQYLRTHTRSHTGEKHPHQCQHCDKHFATAARLKNHAKLHSKERPFKCQVCGRAFLRKHLLKLHMRAHDGKKPYKCPHCTRRYHCSDGRERHIESMHFGTLVNCEVCNENVAVEALDVHMLQTHQETYQRIDSELLLNDASSGESGDGSHGDSDDEDESSNPIGRSEADVPSDEAEQMDEMSGGSLAGDVQPCHDVSSTDSHETTGPVVGMATGASLKPIGRIGVGKDNARTVNVSAVVGPSSNLIGRSTDTTNKEPLFINIGGKLYARIT